VEAATRVRRVVTEAVQELIGRVRAGAALQIEALHEASSSLLSEVGGDASAVVTLTYLHHCDDYTVEHSADVAILMVAIARILAVPASELPVLALAGLMHDVGKQLLPNELLQKPGTLTCEEFAEIRKHPQHGFDLLAGCDGCPDAVRAVALQHHERLDGSGYPARLTREQLHPYSRIAAVADTFDAMTADRVYRRGCPPRTAILELYRDRQQRLDPEAVEALIHLVGVYPVGTRVRLSTGERGVVVAPNPHDTTRPVVWIDRDRHARVLAVPFTLSLDGEARQVAGADETP
jgi:HD-GYP domain-containing protein (c-di-GMP phosphodiesterase class II)